MPNRIIHKYETLFDQIGHKTAHTLMDMYDENDF